MSQSEIVGTKFGHNPSPSYPASIQVAQLFPILQIGILSNVLFE